MMFHQRHEHRFTTKNLRKIKENIQEGKEDDALTTGRQIYIGGMNCCRGTVCGRTWKQCDCNHWEKGEFDSHSYGYKVHTDGKTKEFSEEEIRYPTNNYWST